MSSCVTNCSLAWDINTAEEQAACPQTIVFIATFETCVMETFLRLLFAFVENIDLSNVLMATGPRKRSHPPGFPPSVSQGGITS